MNGTIPGDNPERRFLFLLASSRKDGNSEALALRSAAALPSHVEQQWIRLRDLSLPAFEDVRHSGSGTYPMPRGPLHTLLNATLHATDLVFVAPLYWYGLPADAKLYLDHWSGWMRVPGVDFLARMDGKKMWAITAISDRDYSSADPLFGTLRLTAGYAKMRWAGSLLGYGNKPGEVLSDTVAMAAADSFFC
jgi:multimeric flavodoxin WrbA